MQSLPTPLRPGLEGPDSLHPAPPGPEREAASRRDPPSPGFGRWPWWTPFCALAAALLAIAGPIALLDRVRFPFEAVAGELLFAVFLLGFAWISMSRFGGRPRPAELGLRATPSRAAVGWVVLARLAFVICVAIYIQAAGGVTPNLPVRPLAGVDTVDALDVVIAVAVLAPLVEELFFRGFMYGSLRGKLPPFWAALIVGAVFGAIHPLFGGAAWNLVPVLALGGFAMCLLYERTGSLWPAIAFHCSMNISVLTVVAGSDTAALALEGGALLLFLLAPWRFLKRREAAGGPAAPTPRTPASAI